MELKVENMKISKHLTLVELTRSDSAKRKGISNIPTEAHLANLKLLAQKVFEPIREHFGVPIYVTSGYRCQKLNKAIGGVSTSQHTLGQAIDIDMDGSDDGVTNKMVFDFIKDNLVFDQLIYEGGTDENPDWVHVSYNSSGFQRKTILKMVKEGKKSTYIKI